ncbi:uncharacterized protein LOC112136329 isoform X2 [Oryzias melastigma]|uniref:uncharacterized protein LOC112136329 isoform X2 n=1 Tax=Oryzias melastigma TaxID=30732 RepID=UPI000CF7C6A6|nr:uncharacterized protein LOC112136329 isoform X2 [Oryzias melastigma]
MRRKELKHADMRRGDALLSVLEFYILMKEEARQPIREAGAGADHRGSDSRGVRGRLGGPPARPAARRPRVSWWQVVRPSGQDKSPLLWLWSPPPPPPVLTVLGCSYRCCTTAEDSERSGREEGQTGLIPTTTSSRGAASTRSSASPVIPPTHPAGGATCRSHQDAELSLCPPGRARPSGMLWFSLRQSAIC